MIDAGNPFVAAILGGAVGGIIVAFVESLLRRSDERARWLRDERQRRFAEVAAAVEAVYHAQQALLELHRESDPRPPDVRQRAEALAELLRRGTEAERAQLLLSLVASPEMTRRGDALVGSAQEMSEWFDARGPDVSWAEIQDAWQLSWEEIDEFVQLARSELGSGNEPRLAGRAWLRRLRAREARHPDREDDGPGRSTPQPPPGDAPG